jgi:hypothetical protein
MDALAAGMGDIEEPLDRQFEERSCLDDFDKRD